MSISNTQHGFIALISTLIISVMLLVAVISLGQRGVIGRFLLLDFERKAQSEALAESCVNVATIAAVNDPSYTDSNHVIPVGMLSCTIVSVTPLSGQSRIHAKGTTGGAITNYEAVINTSDGTISLWKECKDLIGGTCH